jgi:hypothetical protein
MRKEEKKLTKKERAEKLKIWRYNKWLRLHRRELNEKVDDYLWKLGHTFDQQPKHIFGA